MNAFGTRQDECSWVLVAMMQMGRDVHIATVQHDEIIAAESQAFMVIMLLYHTVNLDKTPVGYGVHDSQQDLMAGERLVMLAGDRLDPIQLAGVSCRVESRGRVIGGID